ncbi:MAG TPA: D-isomer specific 2-hydroxyacid dehydrogenase family protein [Candidatus Limnocylindrales bacterium]|nr:D-isomer specific 2-hydroxyacid dehydrogenase family protein [Candidatus Limnocylindrales bacterium]
MSAGIALGGEADGWLRDAVEAGGGRIVPLGQAEALIWGGGDADQLRAMLAAAPGLRWVQLPSAGVEQYLPLMGDGRTWTAAKGVFADQCAEQVLGLAIAGFRHLDAGARQRRWHRGDGKSLFGASVAIVGGGGIAASTLRLLAPFRVEATVVRRRPDPVPRARRTVPSSQLMEVLKDADLVVLAAPLTAATEGMIGAAQLRAMREDAWLINVARGKLVRTPDLVRALQEGWIGGAGLDVTDPEPLPAGHPLWQFDNCIITSHTANPPNLERAVLGPRITENVRRYVTGEPLLGGVDVEAGY